MRCIFIWLGFYYIKCKSDCFSDYDVAALGMVGNIKTLLLIKMKKHVYFNQKNRKSIFIKYINLSTKLCRWCLRYLKIKRKYKNYNN